MQYPYGQWLQFKGANNTRDIGGYKTINGRMVRHNRIIRSGELSGVGKKGCCVLKEKYDIKTAIDLRAFGEIDYHPLSSFFDIQTEQIPILQNAMFGFTDDNDSMPNKLKALIEANVSQQDFMNRCYLTMISDPNSQKGYKRLFDILSEQEQGASLFFCSQGRDRTGIATALILAALGVPIKTIIDDYLITDKSVLIKQKEIRLLRAVHYIDKEYADFAEHFLMPCVERLDIALEWINTEYGSINNYLINAIGLTGYEINELRKLYLI